MPWLHAKSLQAPFQPFDAAFGKILSAFAGRRQGIRKRKLVIACVLVKELFGSVQNSTFQGCVYILTSERRALLGVFSQWRDRSVGTGKCQEGERYETSRGAKKPLRKTLRPSAPSTSGEMRVNH